MRTFNHAIAGDERVVNPTASERKLKIVVPVAQAQKGMRAQMAMAERLQALLDRIQTLLDRRAVARSPGGPGFGRGDGCHR